MKVRTFTVGYLATNCYVAECGKTRNAIIIDPGFVSSGEAEQIVHYVEEAELKIKFIVNTHGHWDHVGGDIMLEKKYYVPICIHESEVHTEVDLNAEPSLRNIVLRDGVPREPQNNSLDSVIHLPFGGGDLDILEFLVDLTAK